MPLTKVPATSTDDCHILYEKITSSSQCRTQVNFEKIPTAMNCSNHVVQNCICTCKLTGPEYPNYAVEELAFFLKLQSGSMQCPADVKIKALAEESVDLGIEVLGSDGSAKSADTEKNSEDLDCEVVRAKSADTSDPDANQLAKKLDLTKKSEIRPQETAPKNCGILNDLDKELKYDSVSLATRMKLQAKKRPKTAMKIDKNKTSYRSCDICRALVKSEHDLKRHLWEHVNDTKGNADIYSKSIAALQQLDHRTRTSKLRKRKICGICNKKFLKLADLLYHNNISHADQRPYQCRLCHKNYTRNNHLTRHELTHHE